MATDPLKEFRDRMANEKAPEPALAPSGLLVYQAFDAKDKVIRLDIHRAAGPSHALPYAYLLDVIYGRRFYTKFLLVYRFLLIEVKGKNLREVILALKQHRAEYLQEYHPREFEAPEADMPFIESIDIIVKDMSEAMHAADSTLDEPQP